MDMSRQYGSYDAANSPEAIAAEQRRKAQQAADGGGGGVGGWLFGNQKDPGLTGAGMRTPNQVGVREDLAGLPGYTEDRSRSLAGALAAQGRNGPQMQGAQLDGSQQAQVRGQQGSLAQMLMAQANGTGPSLAQGQLQRATDNNIAQTMALGQSMGRGSAPGLAMRGIQQQSGQLQQQAAGDSAQMRMQEQMQAQNSLGQLLAGMRGQDIGLAAENAQLTQGANGQNLAALLQQRGMNDQMTMGYERNALGLGAQQGNMNMDLAKLLASTGLKNEELAQGAYEDAARRRAGLLKTGMDAFGNVAGAAGTALASGAVASDERAKTNIVRHEAEALPGVPWASWTYLPEFGGGESFGVIAQDLEKVSPSHVIERNGIKFVDYSFLERSASIQPHLGGFHVSCPPRVHGADKQEGNSGARDLASVSSSVSVSSEKGQHLPDIGGAEQATHNAPDSERPCFAAARPSEKKCADAVEQHEKHHEEAGQEHHRSIHLTASLG